MTAQFAKDQMSFFPANTMSANAPTVFAPATDSGFAGRVRGVATWLSQAFQRRAVINELSMLSDYELADIGLSRADIPNVFDRGFVAGRFSPNAARS
jgi:uncharacterized protein YjiS (DUF1127 family)